MADRLMPSPKREDKVVRSRLDTGHLGRWKNIQSRLKSPFLCSFPSKRGIPSECASDSVDPDPF